PRQTRRVAQQASPRLDSLASSSSARPSILLKSSQTFGFRRTVGSSLDPRMAMKTSRSTDQSRHSSQGVLHPQAEPYVRMALHPIKLLDSVLPHRYLLFQSANMACGREFFCPVPILGTGQYEPHYAGAAGMKPINRRAG